ncbi:MAG TPA: RNA polymerase sigma factor [Pirellulales bacterium]|nr:RNA polymerase sigma factor [Pirellulales bacterium]
MNDFSAVITAHSDAVWRTAYRLLNHRDDALDCYQETFLAALRLSSKGEVRHWRTMLVRIATRRAIDRLRQRYQGEKVSCDSERLSDGGSPAEAPDARALGEELREQVRRALGELPDEQAEAFWLRHVERLSVGEVAESMGIETGHVRVLAHRAALALRELLGPSLGPESTAEKLP